MGSIFALLWGSVGTLRRFAGCYLVFDTICDSFRCYACKVSVGLLEIWNRDSGIGDWGLRIEGLMIRDHM